MDVTLIDALVLIAVVAFLMMGYSSRRVATASAIRGINRDNIKGTYHHKADKTLLVLRERISLESQMLIYSSFGAFFGFICAVLVMAESNSLAQVAFLLGLLGGVVSILLSIKEQMIANDSHFTELDDTVSKHDPYHKSKSP